MCECGESEEAGQYKNCRLCGKVLKVISNVSTLEIINLCDTAASSAGEHSSTSLLGRATVRNIQWNSAVTLLIGLNSAEILTPRPCWFVQGQWV